MQTVSTELDAYILAAAGLAVLLLLGVLIAVNKLTAFNKQLLQNQKNQNDLLLKISDVLTSKAKGENLQNREGAMVGETTTEKSAD